MYPSPGVSHRDQGTEELAGSEQGDAWTSEVSDGTPQASLDRGPAWVDFCLIILTKSKSNRIHCQRTEKNKDRKTRQPNERVSQHWNENENWNLHKQSLTDVIAYIERVSYFSYN